MSPPDASHDSKRAPIREGNLPEDVPTYPKRNAFDAHRITRLAFKSCLAQDIGHAAVLLIIHIAHTEDAARYSGPVRFWNSQLIETLGLSSEKVLRSIRQKAIEARWLVYQRESNRQVGLYWVTVPEDVGGIPDTPIEPNLSPNTSLNTGAEGQGTDGFRAHERTDSGQMNGRIQGTSSIPVPSPFPKPKPHGNHGALKSFSEQVWRSLTDEAVRAFAAKPTEEPLRELFRVGVKHWKWPDDGVHWLKFLAMVQHCGTSPKIRNPAAALKSHMTKKAFHLLTDADEAWAQQNARAWNRQSSANIVPNLAAERAGQSATDSMEASRNKQLSGLQAVGKHFDRNNQSRAGPTSGATLPSPGPLQNTG